MKKIILILLLIIVAGIYKFNFTDDDVSAVQNGDDAASLNDTQEKSSKGVVNLSNQGLNQIPSYVFNRVNTEELNVSNNSLIGSIQAEIRHLSNLKILNASNNNMTGLPAEVGQLQKLEVLDLSNNNLTGLPNELGNLDNLKILNLSGNEYSKHDLDIIRESLPSTTNIITD